MTAPKAKHKVLKLTRQMARYDFSKEPLFGADIVIAKDGRVCKDRNGTAGRDATPGERAAAVEAKPNR